MNQDNNSMPSMGFLRLPQVLSFIPVSKTAFYDGILKGRFPKPVKLSARTSAWRVEDIKNLITELGGVK
ncbi:MAG: AlpA family phage regulatory protein [Mariprofundaceae bacterium]|nr:AlpA family phage regulatory protein [Mariprofundaceae bacterium]